MTKTLSLLLASGAAAGAWYFSPLLGEDFTQAWFIGTGNWHTIAIHGREIVAAGLGASAWITGLHYAR